MKILSVDDSSVIRKIIRAAAEVLHCTLLEAEDGIEALEIAEKKGVEIDLILLDINMPGMDGLELLKRLKQKGGLKKIPVMMVTTESEHENIIKSIQLGAINYLVKPFTMEQLIKKILESIGKGE